jgi:leishmanolysin
MIIYPKIKYYIIYTLFLEFIFSHRACGGVRDSNVTLFNSYPNKGKRILDSSNWSPIRIYVDYYNLHQMNLSSPMLSSIKTIVNQTVSVIQTLINVQPSGYNISINSCGGIPVSPEVISGVDADLIIIPGFDNNLDDGTEAYSSICVQDSWNYRPLAGLISFTRNIRYNEPNWLQYNTVLALHELTHVLVFSEKLFYNFTNSDGSIKEFSDVITKQTINGVERIMIKTPKVVAAAKKHFGCNNVIGVELENQGGVGTMTNHWEARIMLTDYMIGVSYDETTISDITLALLEDSGWYKTNNYTAGLFRYGKNQGCSFLNSKCIVDGKTPFPEEYCDSSALPTCSNGRVFKGNCFFQNSNQITTPYQYFGSTSRGGFRDSDYCPIPVAPSGSKLMEYNCIYGVDNMYPSSLEEKISTNSACFLSSLVNINYAANLTNYIGKVKAICYQYYCDDINKGVIVNVGKVNSTCPTSGGNITFPGYSGELYCPDYNSLCTMSSFCYDIIDCVLKKVIEKNNTYEYNYIRNYQIPTKEGIVFLTSNSNYLNVFKFISFFVICIFI